MVGRRLRRPGQQEVQGTAALAFVRQRHGLPEGDLDRVRRQQAFLSGAADKMLSVGTLTNPSKLNDLVDAVDRSVIFDKGFSVLTFAEQITNLSSGNINFETLPTTGPEPSTDKDALATDPAAIKAFFAAITGGSAAAAPGTTAPGRTVDPASITVDVQDGTIADGVTSFAAETINDGRLHPRVARRRRRDQGRQRAGDHRGALPGRTRPARRSRWPTPSASATLVEDDAIKSGHVLVVVGHRPGRAVRLRRRPAALCAGRGRTGARRRHDRAATAGSARCVSCTTSARGVPVPNDGR